LATERDGEALAAIYRPVVETTAISFETTAPDANEMARRIRDTTVTHPWLVYEVGDLVAGYAYATRHRVRAAYQWSVDTSVYVDARCRRNGVGRRLYASLFALLKAQGFANAFAGISLPNAGSVGLHEAMGFVAIGVYRNVGYKLGQWRDVGWWQLSLAPYDPPAAPLDLETLRQRLDIEAIIAAGERG
jgi:phosphinothricin acetyltransferase